MIGVWEEEEVKTLFKLVEDCKKNNISIKEAFLKHAQLYARKPNSVRNYYYHEVDNLNKDNERAKTLGIDITLHEKNNIEYFTKEAEGKLIEQIKGLTSSGISVRKACLTLAGGNVELLLRYQNKYRNYLAKQKGKAISSNNVITFKKPSKGLSESEIQSLFLGLVRLVKKNAILEGEEKYKEKLNHANSQLRKAIVELQSQAREIEKIKAQYSLLKQQSQVLGQSLLLSRCDRADKLRDKMNSLSNKSNKILENENI